MQINFLQKPAPTIVSCESRPKWNRIRWQVSRDPDHERYAIWRYTSFANATNDVSGTLLDDEISRIRYEDDDALSMATDYWYRVASIDKWDNQSAKSGIVSTTFQGVKAADIPDGELTDPKFDPTAPGLPTSVAVNPGNLAYDADKKVHATAIVSWIAPVGGRTPARYRVIQTNIATGEVERYTTDTADLSISVPVRSGVAYNYQVASISKTGNRSSFTTAVSYTRPKKTVNLPAPGTLTLVSTKKRISVEWADVDEQTYPDYDVTYIYSNTTNTVPVPGTTARWKATRAGKISRDGLANATTYYFWICHRDKAGNFGALSAVVSGQSTGTEVTSFSDLSGSIDGSQIPDGAVSDRTLDETSPNLPTSVAVNPGTLSYDSDKKAHAYAIVTWAAPASGRAAARYRVRVTEVSSGEVRRFDVDGADLQCVVPVKSGVAYNYEVAAIAKGSGKRGSFTTPVSYTRPKKTVNLPAPGTLTLNSNKKRIVIDWADVDEQTYPDFDVTYVYSNTTGTVPVPGTTAPWKKTRSGYILRDNLANATTYYFWICHRDKAGNFGALSAVVSGQSTGTEVTSFSDLTGTATGAQLAAGRGTNLLINTNANLSANYWRELADSNNNTNFQIGAINYAWAPKGERVFVLEQLDGTSTSYADVVQADEQGNDRKIPVKANQRYEFHLLTGAHRCTGRAYIMWFDSTDTNLSNVFTDDNASQMSGGQNLANYKQIGVFAIAPATAAYAKIVVRKMNTTAGATPANSYLFYTHLFFGEAGANQTEYSPWAENGNLITTADTVDSRAPTTPTTLAVTFGSIEVDEDGKSIPYAVASWVQPTTAAPVAYYRVKVTQNSNGEVRIFETENLNLTFEVKTNKQYDVQVRAISAFDKRSAFTGIVSYTRPKKSALPNPPTGVSIVQKPNGNMVKWTAPSDRDVAYYNIYIGTTSTAGSATKIASTDATYHLDQEVRTVGTNYYYFVTSVDRSGNESSTRVAASNNPQTYRQIVTAEIGANQVNTTQIAPAAVTAPELAPAAVVPSKYLISPASDLLIDYELTDATQWSFKEYQYYAGGSGYPTTEATAIALPPARAVQSPNPTVDNRGASDFKFTLEVGQSQNMLMIENAALVPVTPKEKYLVTNFIEQITPSPGVQFAGHAMMDIRFWRKNALGAIEFVDQISAAWNSETAFWETGNVSTEPFAMFTAPDGCSYASFRIRIRPVSGNPYKIKFIFASPSVKKIQNPSIARNVFRYWNNANLAFGAAAAGAEIARIELPVVENEPDYYAHALITLSFKNNSGKLMEGAVRIRLWYSEPGTYDEVAYLPVVRLQDRNPFSFTWQTGYELSGTGSGGISRGIRGDGSGLPYYVEARFLADQADNLIGQRSFIIDAYDSL